MCKDQARSLDNIIRALKLKLETSQRSRILKSMMNVPAKTGNCNTVAIQKLFSDPEIKSKAIPAYNKLPDGKNQTIPYFKRSSRYSSKNSR